MSWIWRNFLRLIRVPLIVIAGVVKFIMVNVDNVVEVIRKMIVRSKEEKKK